MIGESMRTHLLSDAGVIAISTRIYPHHLPQNVTFPAVTYNIDGDEREEVFGGASSLKTVLVTIDSWGMTYTEVWDLADAIEDALVGSSGDFGTLSPPDVVDHVRMERGSFDLFETDTKLYRVSQQFLIAYY